METIKAINEATKIARLLLNEESENPVLKHQNKADYQALVDLSLTAYGCDEASFFEALKEIVLLTPRTNSNSFFNQLFAGRSAPALSAEILTSILNTTMHTYKVAGIQVLIEQEVVGKMLAKIGYKNGEATMNPGGSMSNMVSMMVARNEKVATIAQSGFSGEKLIVYTSEEGHYSIRKNAQILGIGKENVRFVETDYDGRMDVNNLEYQVKEDLSKGFIPFYINATAGTTVFGVFDPFKEIAAIAKEYGLWLHIDGALGGSALMSAEHKHLLEGVELSDSFTWNAHKMMNVPISAAFLFLNKKGLLSKHLSEKADYLFQGEQEDLDLGNSSIQCGRRVDAFKVWAVWKYYGASGIEQRINHLFDLAQYAAACIEKEPSFKLFRTPESVNVCFTIEGVSAEAVCKKMHEEGLAMVGYSKSKGATFVRISFINANLQYEDVDNFFEQVKKVSGLV